jgi:hypothetical protein
MTGTEKVMKNLIQFFTDTRGWASYCMFFVYPYYHSINMSSDAAENIGREELSLARQTLANLLRQTLVFVRMRS